MAKGNARSSGYERADHDWYLEPLEATFALLDEERFVGTVYDPACGQGNILRACSERGLECYGSDLIDRGWPMAPFRSVTAGVDFLDAPLRAEPPDNIICNPPYTFAEQFVERSIKLARFKAAFLLRLGFLEGLKRSRLLETSPLSCVLVFRNRLSMPPGGMDVEAKGGFQAFAWFVFDHDRRGPPTIGWISCARPAKAPKQ